MSKELLPEGNYRAVAVPRPAEGSNVEKYAHFCFVGDDNHRMVVSYFEILDAPDGTRPAYPLRWGGFLTTKDRDGNQKTDKKGKTAAQRTIESLRAMGLKGDDLGAAEEQDLDQVVSVVVRHEEYDEKTRVSIVFVNALGSGSVKLAKPMTKQDLSKFSAIMKSSMGKCAQVDGERHKRNTEPDAPSMSMNRNEPPPLSDDDEIPF